MPGMSKKTDESSYKQVNDFLNYSLIEDNFSCFVKVCIGLFLLKICLSSHEVSTISTTYLLSIKSLNRK